MDNGKTEEDLLHELILMQQDLKEKVDSHERFISRFQLLVQHKGLFSQVIGNLPFPVAIFAYTGVVLMANNLLMQQAGIKPAELSEGKLNLLDRVTDENYGVFEAAEDVFAGETTVVKGLVLPLALFCRAESGAQDDPYHTAVFFPVPDGDGSRNGAVMLME